MTSTCSESKFREASSAGNGRYGSTVVPTRGEVSRALSSLGLIILLFNFVPLFSRRLDVGVGGGISRLVPEAENSAGSLEDGVDSCVKRRRFCLNVPGSFLSKI